MEKLSSRWTDNRKFVKRINLLLKEQQHASLHTHNIDPIGEKNFMFATI